MRQARQRQSQVCGVHGWGSSGFGQQIHLWALPNPEPGAMAISPGRCVFRPLTGVTALGLVAGLRPTHLAGGHGQAEAASRFHRTLPWVEPARHGLDTAGGPKANAQRPSPPTAALPPAGGELPSKGRANKAD